MQKLVIAVLAFLLINGIPQVKGEGIQFEKGSWTEILKKAQSENKLIFVDCMTTWCRPCKWMEGKVMSQPEVASFYNEHFINVQLNMEKGIGKKFAKQYSINGFPTLAYLNGEEQMIWRAVGAHDAEKFIALGQEALEQVRPIQEFYDQYASGDYDRDFLYAYLMRCRRDGVRNKEAVAEYMAGMTPGKMMEEKDFNIFYHYIKEVDSPFFTEFEENLEAYQKKYGDEKVNMKYYSSWMKVLNHAVDSNDQTRVNQVASQLEAKLEVKPYEYVKPWIRKALIENQMRNFTREECYALVNNYIDQDLELVPISVIRVAWMVYEEEKDPEIIQNAITWCEYVYQKSELLEEHAFPLLDTWGRLLKKNGDLEGAAEKLEEGLKQGQGTGFYLTPTEKELKKIKRKLGK